MKNKKGAIAAAELVRQMLLGGDRAIRLFDRATGGCRLNDACEYLLTVSIFERLALLDRGATHLEVPVRACRKEAGAVRPGKPAKEDRLTGRFDIVHYWSAGKSLPRVAVEVKSAISHLVKHKFTYDFGRIVRAISCNQESSFQFGVFLFCASVSFPAKPGSMAEKRKIAKKRMGALLEKVSKLSKSQVDDCGKPLIRRIYKGKPIYSKDQDEGISQIALVVFAHKTQSAIFPAKLPPA